MYVLQGEVNQLYPVVIQDIMSLGKSQNIDRPDVVDHETYEIHPAALTLCNPAKRLVTSHGRSLNVAFALAEVMWILGGRRDVEMLKAYNSTIDQFSDDGIKFNAAYGYRLRTDFGVDQIDDVIRTLKDDPSSRQATLVISNPVDDKGWDRLPSHNGGVGDWTYVKHATKDRACNVLSHLMIRNDTLDWMQIIRSNDAVWGTPYNWMQFTHLMEWIANTLGVPMGDYFHIVDSLHIYSHHFAEAEAIAEFDLYEYTEVPEPMQVGQQVINTVLREEEIIRRSRTNWGLPSEDFAAVGHYWYNVLRILYAHRLYATGNDVKCFDVLARATEVYGWAQMRFYYANRWYKPEHKDTIHTLLGRTMLPQDVFDWITGSANDAA